MFLTALTLSAATCLAQDAEAGRDLLAAVDRWRGTEHLTRDAEARRVLALDLAREAAQYGRVVRLAAALDRELDPHAARACSDGEREGTAGSALGEVEHALLVTHDGRHAHALARWTRDVPPARERVRVTLEGDVPSPVNPPTGCRFRTRCWRATEICAEQEPPFVEQASGAYAACHFPIEPGEPVAVALAQSG